MDEVHAAPAAYHPHLLRCNADTPIPAIGTPIFASKPEIDEENRLVYIPFGDAEYFERHAGLAELFMLHPFELGNIIADTTLTVPGIRKKLVEFVQRKYPLSERARDEAESFGERDAIADKKGLYLEPPRFIGIMVPDNLSPDARMWWTRSGVLQATTCVKGVCDVAVSAFEDDAAAFDMFAPMSLAAWDTKESIVVPYERKESQVVIGRVLTASINSIKIYVDISKTLKPVQAPPE
jgi:hypothetical protein